jgi:hypothetical protein
MRFPIIEFPSNHFTYSKHSNCLYDDACDVGFAVKSSQSGEVVTFHMVNVMKDGEGEVTGWEYELTDESARKYPECGRMTAKVFND